MNNEQIIKELRELRDGAKCTDDHCLCERYDRIIDALSESEKRPHTFQVLTELKDKLEGALNMALEHLGYQGVDHEQFCREKYDCNVYGDELEEEE